MPPGLSRSFVGFWVLGLLNNVLYVVILSAAIDLVGTETPKGVVLLADVLPAFFVKTTAPFHIHLIPYAVRIGLLVGLSFFGMQIIALAAGVPGRLVGIVFASLSSGLGELTMLQLTHYYDTSAINGFSSGTGGAGLVGSVVFMALTTWLGVSTRVSLLLFSVLPFCFIIVYARVLPPREHIPLVHVNAPEPPKLSVGGFWDTLGRVRPLVVPYVVPLMSVYIGEYVINQGISPTLLFDIQDMPFERYRDAYVAYGALYQTGVFISRSSAPWFRIRSLYSPAVLQTVNVFICILQSLYMIIPSIYLVFVLVFYEGLLGGLAYVNTYMQVSEQVPIQQREFSMGAVSMSDSCGVVLAGVLSLWLEPKLCNYQTSTGRPWCREP